jgi:CheY-like chemotaxis protein
MSKGRILVVEDDMDNYELVRFILERAGYDVFLAVNGRDGVDAARFQKPDLILMDIERKRAIQAGCDGYVSKPIHVDTFLKVIESALAGKKNKKTAPTTRSFTSK